jgi:dihydroflavonol-4-reductase
MRVAVTGATGHVGVNLVRRLVELGHEVRAVIHVDRRGLEGVSLQLHDGDLLDPVSLEPAFEGIEIVYHLAARISIAPGDEHLVHAANVVGTRNVVRACMRVGVKRLVHFSSIHAFSSKPVDQVIDESRPLADGKHLLPYDRSKADAEREVREGMSRGLNAIVLSPTAILGPHDVRPSPMGRVLLDLYRGRLLALVRGGFDWVDVRDVVQGAVTAAELAPSGEKYLLSGQRRTLRELAKAVEEVSGRKPPRFTSPMWLARAAAPFSTAYAKVTGKAPRLTGASLHALRNHQWVSHEKATRELDYHPRPFEQTIEASFAWFRSAGVIQ